MATVNNILDTYKYGKYYNPATSHYNNPTTTVICDRCGKQNLITAIGYDEFDLCLKCVYIMGKNESKKKDALNKSSIDNIKHQINLSEQNNIKKFIEQQIRKSLDTPTMPIKDDDENEATFMEQDMYSNEDY